MCTREIVHLYQMGFVYILQQLCLTHVEWVLPTWCQGSCHSTHTHRERETVPADLFCVWVYVLGGERASCSVKPWSTVLDYPICLPIHSQTQPHTYAYTWSFCRLIRHTWPTSHSLESVVTITCILWTFMSTEYLDILFREMKMFWWN